MKKIKQKKRSAGIKSPKFLFHKKLDANKPKEFNKDTTQYMDFKSLFSNQDQAANQQQNQQAA